MECVLRHRSVTSGYERASILLVAGVLISGLIALQAWADAMSHSLLIDVGSGRGHKLTMFGVGDGSHLAYALLIGFAVVSMIAAGGFILAERRRLVRETGPRGVDPDAEISHLVEQVDVRELVPRFMARTILFTGVLLVVTLVADLYVKAISPETAGALSFAIPSVALICAAMGFAAVAAIVTLVGSRTLVAMRRLRLELARLVVRTALRSPARPAKVNRRKKAGESFGDDVLSRPPPPVMHAMTAAAAADDTELG